MPILNYDTVVINFTHKEKLKFILFALVAAFIVLPVHAQEEKTIKRKVAIGRFSNETQYGKGLFYDNV